MTQRRARAANPEVSFRSETLEGENRKRGVSLAGLIVPSLPQETTNFKLDLARGASYPATVYRDEVRLGLRARQRELAAERRKTCP